MKKTFQFSQRSISHLKPTLWRRLLSYGYCYKASCARPG